MMLPPLGYHGDAREVAAFYRAVAEAGGLPLMAYNNPAASGSDMPPALIAALGERDRERRRREGVLGRRAPHPGDHRRRAGPRGPRRRRRLGARGTRAGATGWVTGVADVVPAECVELYERCRAGELDRARAIYQRMLPLARFDMTPKLVQYFKAAMDEVGLVGGAVRPPRLAAHRRRARRPRRRAARRCTRASWHEGGALLRRRRLPHGGDAHARRSRAASGRSRARRCSSAARTSSPRWTTCACC